MQQDGIADNFKCLSHKLVHVILPFHEVALFATTDNVVRKITKSIVYAIHAVQRASSTSTVATLRYNQSSEVLFGQWYRVATCFGLTSYGCPVPIDLALCVVTHCVCCVRINKSLPFSVSLVFGCRTTWHVQYSTPFVRSFCGDRHFRCGDRSLAFTDTARRTQCSPYWTRKHVNAVTMTYIYISNYGLKPHFTQAMHSLQSSNDIIWILDSATSRNNNSTINVCWHWRYRSTVWTKTS